MQIAKTIGSHMEHENRPDDDSEARPGQNQETPKEQPEQDIEKAKGILLTIVDDAIDLTPAVGTAKLAHEAATGKELITGGKLSPIQRKEKAAEAAISIAVPFGIPALKLKKALTAVRNLKKEAGILKKLITAMKEKLTRFFN